MAMLPHTDAFLPAHNLQSLGELADLLAHPPPSAHGIQLRRRAQPRQRPSAP
jgi:hypothetical protein